MQVSIVLGLLALAIILFAAEKISVDIITLLLLVVLVLTKILTPAEAFAGFSNEIMIILASVFVISGALQKSGVMDALGARLYKIAAASETRLLLITMTIVAVLSAFANNTMVTATFVPPTMGVARQAEVSVSKLLMPLAFASILGGNCTLIGASTNLAVSGYLGKVGLLPLTMFEITPVGIILAIVGIVYMLTIGKQMLPEYRNESLTEGYAIREYLTEIVVMSNSKLIGQRIFESDLSKKEFRILEVIRGSATILPGPRTTIEARDILLVEGKVEELIKVKHTAGVEIRANVQVSDGDLQNEDIRIVEVFITSQSDLIGQTLKEANFRARYGVFALAIYRHGQSLREKIAKIPLRFGDILLVQGTAEKLDDLKRHPDLWVMEEFKPAPYSRRQGLYTIAFFIAAIFASSFGVAPLSIALLMAAVLCVLCRCINVEEVYEFINWRLFILIGGMTAFGTAMAKTGAADFLASQIVGGIKPLVSGLPEPFGIVLILAGFFLLTVVLTQPMSNVAAALVVLPVALAAATRLGVNERTFAIAIMLAAAVSFITPFEPSCILVYGPGKYRFMDFVKAGTLLTFILMVIVLLTVPIFWPLHPVAGHGR